jgi:hypothetical protein
MAWCSVKAQGQLYLTLPYLILPLSILTVFYFLLCTYCIYDQQVDIQPQISRNCMCFWMAVLLISGMEGSTEPLRYITSQMAGVYLMCVTMARRVLLLRMGSSCEYIE